MKTDIADKLIIKGLLARGYPITGIADKLGLYRCNISKLMAKDKEYPSLKLLSVVNGQNAVKENWPDIVYKLERNASTEAIAGQYFIRIKDLREYMATTKYKDRLQTTVHLNIRLKKDVKELLLGQSLTRGYSSLGEYIKAILTKQARS
jgi:hypothetical protein